MKRFLCIFLCVISTLSFVGCSAISSTSAKIYESNARKITKQYLEQKYPHKTFTIQEIELQEEPPGVIDVINSPIYTGVAYVTVQDENGNKFEVQVDGELSTKEGVIDAMDDFQLKEIENAIRDKLIEIFNFVDSDKFDITYGIMPYYHSYFDGNIEQFVKESIDFNKESLPSSFYLTHFYCGEDFDTSKISDNDKEFLKYGYIKFIKCKTEKIKNQLLQDKTQDYDGTYSIYIENVIENKKSKEFTTTSMEFKKEKNIYYARPLKEYEQVEVNLNITPDLSKWEQQIEEYKSENKINEIKNITIITDYFKTEEYYQYFIEKPENEPENVRYILCKETEKKKYLIDIENITENHNICEIGDYIALDLIYPSGTDKYFVIMVEY